MYQTERGEELNIKYADNQEQHWKESEDDSRHLGVARGHVIHTLWSISRQYSPQIVSYCCSSEKTSCKKQNIFNENVLQL